MEFIVFLMRLVMMMMLLMLRRMIDGKNLSLRG
jgi:hypothetical protein